MLPMVHFAGWMPRSIAAFSAFSPKASNPIGCSTLYPFIRMKRAWASAPDIAYQWPMWRSPDG